MFRNDEDENENEGEKKFAVIDDMPMDNFDELIPEDERAIVYPFDLDVF